MRLVVILLFAAYFVIGLILVPDYGVSRDEWRQRRHLLVNYKHVNQVLFGRTPHGLEEYPTLEEYGQLYGVAIQFPLAVVEDLYDFAMSARNTILIRHYYIFFICFLGYICFYLMLRTLFRHDYLIPLLGTFMIALYPRFFATQFTDIKNMVFAALNMVTLLCLVKAVETKRAIWQILFGCAAALATNSRPMAVIFIPLLLGYYLLSDLTALAEKKASGGSGEGWKCLIKYVLVLVSYGLFWVIITPVAWQHPVSTFVDTFTAFSKFDAWDGTMVFMGNRIKCDQMPWYYLFVWFGITIPITYLLLFIAGHVFAVSQWLRSRHKWKDLLSAYRWPLCMMALFWGSVLSVIILHSRIYVGWHHMYFVFVPFCVLACYGLAGLAALVSHRRVVYVAFALVLLYHVGWMVVNHPYEGVYFNVVGRRFGDQFDRDEWQISGYRALKWVLSHDEGAFSVEGTQSVNFLTPEESARIIEEETPKYKIMCYRNVIGNTKTYDGYEEVFSRSVDGYKVYSVYQRIEEAADDETQP